MSKQLRAIWIVSFAFWTVYAGLAFIGSYAFRAMVQASDTRGNLLVWNLGEAYVWVLATPIVWWLACRFGFSRDNWKMSTLVHVAAGWILTCVCSGLLLRIDDIAGWAPTDATFDLRLLDFSLSQFPRYYVTLAIALTVMYYLNLRSRDGELARLETDLSKAQLQVLRSQLDPHFLFNTLSAIATLANKDPRATERMTLQLAALLRTSLETAAPQEIALSKELEFIRNYLAIQETRFSGRLSVRMDIDPRLLDVQVPSLLLQPLVENAIRHGIGKSAAPGCIVITASGGRDHLQLDVVDNGVGMDADAFRWSKGIGLKNTRSRLQQLYGDDFQFDLHDAKDGGCHVRLVIPMPIGRQQS